MLAKELNIEYITREPDENRGSTSKIENTIAIETAMSDNGNSCSRNAKPRFRNSDYVARLLSLLNCRDSKESWLRQGLPR